MTRKWEDHFVDWAKPPGKTESDRIETTISSIRNALNADAFLKSNSKVYVQGSYRNRVNVRQDSDIDVGVIYTGNTFYPDYPGGMSNADFGNIDGDHNYREFKDQVGRALVSYYGASAVTRGNKAFDLHENTYRVDADVVPVFEHRRYSRDGSYICGVQLCPDNGGKIINWPERLFDNANWPNQHYENGVSKNAATNKRYKGVVRIIKKLKNLMGEGGSEIAKQTPGFLVECLVWNCPASCFEGNYWEDDVRNCILFLWSNLKYVALCGEWGEVSEYKHLFKGSPDSKRENAWKFVDQAWDAIGVKT